MDLDKLLNDFAEGRKAEGDKRRRRQEILQELGPEFSNASDDTLENEMFKRESRKRVEQQKKMLGE